MPPAGFEPATGGLEVHCSIQLSYRGPRSGPSWQTRRYRSGVRDLWLFPRRRRPARAGVPVALAGLVLVAAVGCGSRSSGSGGAAPSTPGGLQGAGPTTGVTFAFPDLATTTTAAPTTLVPPATAAADDLAAATGITPLDGFTEIASGPGLGLLDLAAASQGDPRERDALNRFRFRDGHRRGFTKGTEEMLVTVLRFSSPADAQAYLQDTVDSSLVSNGSFLFSVPVPGATGYREQGASQEGEPFVTYGALFTRGDRCYEQLVRSPAAGPERTEADAQALARRQADRVGG